MKKKLAKAKKKLKDTYFSAIHHLRRRQRQEAFRDVGVRVGDRLVVQLDARAGGPVVVDRVKDLDIDKLWRRWIVLRSGMRIRVGMPICEKHTWRRV